jgi:hypothetical protein
VPEIWSGMWQFNWGVFWAVLAVLVIRGICRCLTDAAAGALGLPLPHH